MELKRRKLKFTLDGEEYKVLFPTVRQLDSYQKDLDKNKGKELDCLVSFLDNLGLSKDVSYGLEVTHLEQIVGEISGSKTSGK